MYLAVILDLFSPRVVGWSMSESLQRQLALDALKMALAQRQPPRGLIHHSDRGVQYASQEYRQLLAQHGTVGSISRRGNCWDKAVAESFFATLKKELVYQTRWSTWAPRPAAQSSNTSNCSITAVGAIPHSAICVLINLS